MSEKHGLARPICSDHRKCFDSLGISEQCVDIVESVGPFAWEPDGRVGVFLDPGCRRGEGVSTESTFLRYELILSVLAAF